MVQVSEWRTSWGEHMAIYQFVTSFFARCLALPPDGADETSTIALIFNFFAVTPTALSFSNTVILQILRTVSFDTIKEVMQSREVDSDETLQWLNGSLELAEKKQVILCTFIAYM